MNHYIKQKKMDFCLFLLCFNSSWCWGMWKQKWARQELKQFPQRDSCCPFLQKKLRDWTASNPAGHLGPCLGFTCSTFSCVPLLSDFEKHIRVHYPHLKKSYEMSYCLPFRMVTPEHTFVWRASDEKVVCPAKSGLWLEMPEIGYKELYPSGERHIHAPQNVFSCPLLQLHCITN